METQRHSEQSLWTHQSVMLWWHLHSCHLGKAKGVQKQVIHFQTSKFSRTANQIIESDTQNKSQLGKSMSPAPDILVLVELEGQVLTSHRILLLGPASYRGVPAPSWGHLLEKVRGPGPNPSTGCPTACFLATPSLSVSICEMEIETLTYQSYSGASR